MDEWKLDPSLGEPIFEVFLEDHTKLVVVTKTHTVLNSELIDSPAMNDIFQLFGNKIRSMHNQLEEVRDILDQIKRTIR